VLLTHVLPDGEAINIRILTDSGCGVPCISYFATKKLGLQLEKGQTIKVLGLSSSAVFTNLRARITLSLRDNREVTFTLLLIVIREVDFWRANVPALPDWLDRYDLADPHILNEKVLEFPILIGGSFMALLRMTAVYFRGSFALQKSLAGYVPRGKWDKNDKDEVEIHEIDNDTQTVNIGSADYPTDIELNQEIHKTIEEDRVQLFHDPSNENDMTHQEKLDKLLSAIKIENKRLIIPLTKSDGFPQKVRRNYTVAVQRTKSVQKFLTRGDKFAQAIQILLTNGSQRDTWSKLMKTN
jgi:hypothetical protein